jgi:hypothetical protein
MGDTPPTSWDSGAGIHLSGSGTMLVGDSEGNRIQFNGSTAIVRTNTWVLDATTVFMSSQDNSGTIRLGNLENTTTTATTNHGFMATGDGNMLLKADDSGTNYIKFDADGVGSALEIKTADFEVVGGNVSMKGAVTADTGYLGGTSGWKIATQLIQGMHSSTERIRFDALTTQIQIDGDDALGIMFGDPGAGIDMVNSTPADQKPFAVATTEDGSRTVMRVGSATKYIKVDTGATNVLEIAGKVTADAGQIGDWVITGSNMESDTDYYRGIKMKPSDKIVGYGASSHRTQTISGSFSFGVAPTPPGGGGYYLSDD